MNYLIYTETFPERRPDAPRQTGIGRYCADVASGLGQLGHQVTVLTNDLSSSTDGTALDPVRVEVLGPPVRTRRALWRRRRQVIRRINALRPEVVLVGDPQAHHALAMWPFRSSALVCPVFHGTELAEWSRLHRMGYSSPRTALRSWALRRYVKAADALICNSRFTVRLLHQLVPASGRECVVYPCVQNLLLTKPVDQTCRDDIRARITRNGASATVLLTVARISERKNQLRVIEALHHLGRTGGPAFHYLVVGNVDSPAHEAYLSNLRDYLRRAGLEERVTVIGQTTDDSKVDYLDACDVFIMLGQAVGDSVEGFGISVIEAACRGKPVVVSDHGGMPETVIDGETGVVVRPDDVPAIAHVLDSLARNPALGAMGQAGRRFVVDNFTPAVVAARLHEQLLARHRVG